LIADRDVASAKALAESLGNGSLGFECDVTDGSHVQALRTRVPHVGVLVITAGVFPVRGLSGAGIYEVNLIGTARLLAAFEDAVGEGSVTVCFSSVAGHAVVPAQPVLDVIDDPLGEDFFGRLSAAGSGLEDPMMAYCMSKLGVMRLVRRLALPWGRRGARILSISPGLTDTPMGKMAMGDNPNIERDLETRPIGRICRPEEVASVAAFLYSDGASYMTGCDVLVDGGVIGSLNSAEPPVEQSNASSKRRPSTS
jgi:NAD(P)-dependent dehydrogenase (short-subunit alcohol dehydrogenase family)